MMTSTKNMTAVAALLAIMALSSPARAADTVSFLAPEAQTTEQNGWTYSVTPYFWAAVLSGEISEFNSPVVDIDARFNREVLSRFPLRPLRSNGRRWPKAG